MDENNQKNISQKVNDHQFPCPCGSGKTIVNCCINRREKTIPPRPITSYSNPKCYARSLNDCDLQLTKEHFVSKSVLKLIEVPGKRMTISGPRWLEHKQEKEIYITSIATKTLCKRHNKALSTLDFIGKKFFEFIAGKNLKSEFLFINGNEIERWMLKVLCGQIASGWHSPHQEDWQPSMDWLNILFGDKTVPDDCGFYLLLNDKNIKAQFHQIGPWLVEGDKPGTITGLLFIFAGYLFIFTMGKINNNILSNFISNGFRFGHRPECILITDQADQREIHFGGLPWKNTLYLSISK